jgi:tripartite-type tricarboxylate transporter receptor subunit TctC
MKNSVLLLLAAMACCVTSAFAAGAPAYPSRPVRLLLPFAPGGSADVIGRILSPKLSEAMGQQWVVDNRGGAAGNIAAETVVRAAPDGHTLFLALSTIVTANPALYKLPFSMEKDLQPITTLTLSQYIFVLNPGVPANSLKELIALAKQKPRSLNFSSGGVGSPLHLAIELFQRRAGIDMVHVPFKSGGGATAAVVAGEVQMAASSIASSMQMIKAGRLKAIATTGSRRSQIAPDLPTLIESGFPGLDISSWFGLLAPAGTPAAIVQRIRDETIKVLQMPEIRQALTAQGLQVETSTPQAFAARIRADTKTWAEVIQSAGIKGE